MNEPTTPLMQQYHAVKKQHPGALLLFRLGDFYELFYDDAVVASRLLQITLTARNKEKGQAVPMCGVPYHAAENYIARLIKRGAQSGDLRADGGAGAGEEDCAARSDSRFDAGNGERRGIWWELRKIIIWRRWRERGGGRGCGCWSTDRHTRGGGRVSGASDWIGVRGSFYWRISGNGVFGGKGGGAAAG